MSKPKAAAAPETGTPDSPTFADLEADPEIAPLLDFAPVPRQHTKSNGWTAAMQRLFIGWLAHYGSPTKACDELGKARSGIDKIYKAADAEEFRTSWDDAIALYEQRRIAKVMSRHGGSGGLRAPTASRGNGSGHCARPGPYEAPLAPGQVYNEHGEPEDRESMERRGEEASESIGAKLLRCRRNLLCEISGDPGKRAAFELLTELPIDWEKAARYEPQDHEPWRRPNMREPDMVVTAETGWLGTAVPDYGPDKIGMLRAAINAARIERGLEPVDYDDDWSGDVGENADLSHGSNPKDGKEDEDSVLRSWAAEHSEPAQLEDEPAETPPGPVLSAVEGQRTLSLNTPEAYETLTEKRPDAWRGDLPRAPREWAPEPVLKIGPDPCKAPKSRRGTAPKSGAKPRRSK